MSNGYIEDIKSLPLLTAEQEQELGKKMKEGGEGAAEARNKLIESNLRLVAHFANKYIGLGVDFEDLQSAGEIGLIQAVDRFDYTRGTRFSTYATDWIRQAIRREITKTGGTIRLPEDKAYLRSEFAPVSFDKEVGDEGATIEDFIADENAVDPFEEAVKNELKDIIAKVLDLLSPKETFVLKKLYGIGGGEEMTLEQVGNLPELNLSRERVRQIRESAFRKIRTSYKIRAILGDYAPELGLKDGNPIEL